jgi:hypothetical protein
MKPFLSKSMRPYLRPLSASLMRISPYADANDRLKHRRHIERIAAELDRPVGEVAPLYEDILARLEVEARIKDYLPIFVSKKLKQFFKDARR